MGRSAYQRTDPNASQHGSASQLELHMACLQQIPIRIGYGARSSGDGPRSLSHLLHLIGAVLTSTSAGSFRVHSSASSAVAQAVAAQADLDRAGRADRIAMLEAMADSLRGHRTALVEVAAQETNLTPPSLEAELERAAAQLEFQADVVRDGEYLELMVDSHAGVVTHRLLVPLGVVGVFGASNFPFAYGVAGGDTASALAAGCAVVVKEHPSHPATCRMVGEVLAEAAARSGRSPGVVTLVEGFDAGAELVTDERVRAVGFTGSVRGGRALFDLAVQRKDPIPFYGELGSLNPVVVTVGAASSRGALIGNDLGESVVSRAGQMCTKPGLIFVPRGDGGDSLVESMSAVMKGAGPFQLLNSAVREQYDAGVAALVAFEGCVARVGSAPDPDRGVDPVLFEIDRPEPLRTALEEVFGPLTVVVRYSRVEEVSEALASQSAALVAGLYADPVVDAELRSLIGTIERHVGRLVWDGPTTGLPVCWATHHGGNYPASTSTAHTSVGGTAIRRWLKPASYQDVPTGLLPEEFRQLDRLPHRMNGQMVRGVPEDATGVMERR